MRTQRFKEMPWAQFQEVMKRDWVPVQLTGKNIPSFLRQIPNGVLHSIYVSGTVFSGLSFSTQPEPFLFGNHIGGIAVYRKAPNDPVHVNQDVYAVLADARDGSDVLLLVAGPPKDQDQWLADIPERLDGVDVWLVPSDLHNGDQEQRR
jgi:hypothetical protein